MTRTRLWFIPLICTILAGCSSNSFGTSSGNGDEPLFEDRITVGCSVWPGYTCLYVADGEGFFEEQGLDVEIKTYRGTSKLSNEYVAGKMQGRANVTLEVVQEQLRGMRHKVVAAIDFSNGSDAIMALNEIKSVDQFKGQRVAFERNGLEEFFLRWALEENGLTMDDITPVDVNDLNGSAGALESGEADVAVTYEPEVSRLEATGKFQRVYTSADAPGLITDVLTFEEEFVEQYPATIKAFLRAYFKAYQFWQERPDEANKHVARVLKSPIEDIPRQQGGANILSFRENRDTFSFASGLTSLYGNMRRINEFVLEHTAGTTPQLVGTDQLIEPRFIRELAPEFEE